MVSDENSFFEWGFKGLVLAIGAIGGWLWKSLVSTVNGLRRDADKRNKEREKEHNEHVLYAERTFAKSADVRSSFDQLHSGLDDVKKTVQGMAIGQATMAGNMSNIAENLGSLMHAIRNSQGGQKP